jgi:hypothetical protein
MYPFVCPSDQCTDKSSCSHSIKNYSAIKGMNYDTQGHGRTMGMLSERCHTQEHNLLNYNYIKLKDM